MSLRILRRFAPLFVTLIVVFSAHAQISINEILAENRSISNPDDKSVSDWVELFNSGSQPVNLTGYSLTDTTATPKKWVFPANATIPANGFLVVLLDSSRPASTSNQSPLNAGFSIKATGDRLELYNPTPQLVESVRFGPQTANYSIGRVPAGVVSRSHVLCRPTPGAANIQQQLGDPMLLRINEWMASPSSGKDWFELFNPGDLPVQLTGMFFTDDGNSPSPVAPYSFIGTNAFLKFNADNSTNDNEVTFKLGGSGDSISLFTSTGARVDGVLFGQQTVDISQGRLPDGTSTIKSLNTPTPGESNLTKYDGLVINELLAHTDPPLEDAVEFYNQRDNEIDIGGWYLSNKRSELKKYRIPAGTKVPAKGYLVIYEGDFNKDGKGFTFNSAHGDEVYLSEANAAGDLTGNIVTEAFEASANGVSFGRYETVGIQGDYKIVAMERRTFGMDNPTTVEQFRTGKGAPNSGPKIGPVVINEIMYNPGPNPDATDNTLDEYIELRNITGQAVKLYDVDHPTNQWRLQNGIDFTFPPGTSLAASAYALVVSFDPANSTQLSAFRTKFNVPAGVAIFGPYSGKLGNGGDSVELYQPDPPQLPPHPDAGFVPYIRVDKVNFLDVGPWPPEADGTGKSLQRKNSSEFGNDPVNWEAAAPTAGRGSSDTIVDTDGDGLPDAWETANGFNPNDPADASADTDSDGFTNLQEYTAGTNPRDSSSRLAVSNIKFNAAGAVQVTFASVPGKSYTVQFRNDTLTSSSWAKLTSTVATGTELTVEDPDATRPNQRFYRVATPATD